MKPLARSGRKCSALLHCLARYAGLIITLNLTSTETLPAPTATALPLPEKWTISAPLLSPEQRTADVAHAVKDPTVVFHDDLWRVFMTIKCQDRTIMETCSFSDWSHANQTPRTVLQVADSDYYCAPQVFYFRPHAKWFLIYQVGLPQRKFMHVAYSTTTNIADPTSWSKAQWIFPDESSDPRTVGGLDYWIICDDDRAYLFFTSLDGRMWRLWTTLSKFPLGFRDCRLALQGDIFEASHTYKLQGRDAYLTIIEANPSGRRYYKAYISDRLDGEWQPLADSESNPFAGAANVAPAPGVPPWTDNISHGELLRLGSDETLTVDPHNLRFLFQGAWEKDKAKGYGAIPWRLGILTPQNP